ncbi:MAG: endonuclease/exonuclease/phosphatase family protein [Gaiellaceae bacterium]
MNRAPFRLVTWNCRQRVDAKRHALDLLGAHVVVLPECSSSPALAREFGVSFLWRGDYDAKGLAVVGFDGWTVEPLSAPVDLPWVLPARVVDPEGSEAFDLLAVWTVTRGNRLSYSKQVASLLDAWAPALAAGNTIVAGDFNCSLQSTTQTVSHRRNVERFTRLGLRSGYHAFTGDEHGQERVMTLQWVARGGTRRGYHCDFVFLPDRLLGHVTSVGVGPVDVWVDGGLSDHCPVAVEFAGTWAESLDVESRESAPT